jgi:hypothetical protein
MKKKNIPKPETVESSSVERNRINCIDWSSLPVAHIQIEGILDSVYKQQYAKDM